ncbi:hypothetical protein [Streptosporangium sp. NPDC000396]
MLKQRLIGWEPIARHYDQMITYATEPCLSVADLGPTRRPGLPVG